MNKKIGLSDVKVEWLNKRALVLVSIFAHAANKSRGNIIDLRADDVLCQISSLAKKSEDPELISIYKRIKREIKVSLSDAKDSAEAIQKASRLSKVDNFTENLTQRSA